MKKILIVVDMQNDFIDGALGTKEAVAIVPKVEEKIRNFDGEVFFTRDTHETYYLETQEGKNLPVKHCIRDTEGWQIRKELDALRKTEPIDKETFGSKETAVDAIDNEMFERARVAEKIKMLEGYLPDILVKNATIYGILSKGIHELSEEECRKYFPVVKECIYQILGMWESERRKKADEDALSKALSSISSSIK